MTVIGFITSYNRLMRYNRLLDKLSQSEVKMVFKCKDSEKDVVPVDVSIQDDDGNVVICLNDIIVAFFNSDDGSLVVSGLTYGNAAKLGAIGIPLNKTTDNIYTVKCEY
jgi:hypothetical protein